ncbi:MAG: hypothetical protein PHP71_10355 [Methanosarcina sp.]|jgi:hypothetical protein|nr:hypothetical protein [Methanosarcina sp.]MDD3317314.1 hypothetical protein [Methanosarcina sp.]
MNIKSSLMVALIASIMLVGVAAAEYPDAGDTWSTAKSFSYSGQYTYVDGTLTASPADGKDCWYSNSYAVNDWLELYLDSTSVNKGVKAEMFDNDGDLMQRVQKGNNAVLDYTLDRSPVHVDVTGFPGDGDYTFTVYKR